MVQIRAAVAADVPAITEIFNALLDSTTTEWTDEPHTVAGRTAWLAAHDAAGDAVLVAVDGAHGASGASGHAGSSSILGVAAYGDFRDSTRWPGYRFVAEHTIHVAEHAWGRGVGRDLMAGLVDHARRAGKRALVGAIDGANGGSIAFHERLGFREVGRLAGIGEKLGRRLDLVLVQLDLDVDHDVPPAGGAPLS